MISKDLKASLIEAIDPGFELMQSEKWAKLQDFTDVIDNNLDNMEDETVEVLIARTREGLAKIIDKAEELGFNDIELLQFLGVAN